MPVGIACAQCGGPLKVVISTGEFRVKDGSTSDNINFEKIEKVNLTDDTLKDIVGAFNIEVQCIKDPTHPIFNITSSRIKYEICQRIEAGARKLRLKYSG